MTSSAMQPVQTLTGAPAVAKEESAVNPTEIRYGWCPFGDINLVNGDGTMSLYVQPHLIDTPIGTVDNPHHRMLPQGQLIPFQTFGVVSQKPSEDRKDARGRSMLVEDVTIQTALEAIVATMRVYSRWGFTMCVSLQGLDTGTAMRIFQVVQPLRYPLRQLAAELEFGAIDRIAATEPLTFDVVPGYSVEPLRDARERMIATQLAAELLGGAELAINLATEILNETETSMTTAHAGGTGKKGPDALDRRLCEELGRELPKYIGQGAAQAPALPADVTQKIDFLVDRAVNEDQKAEIERLRAELAAFKDQETVTTETVSVITCGFPKADQTPCRSVVPSVGDRCNAHKDK